jgi:phospholipid transport system substrate-binding protein
MLRRSLLTTAVVSLAGALTPTIPAKAGTDPVAFVNNLTTQLEMVAGNPSPEQRRAGFRQLFHEDFDCPRLGRFVLGRFSRILSPSERKEFLRLFEYYVVATYSDRLSEYVGGGVAARVIGSRLDPDGTIVFSEFNRGSGPSTAGAIRVDWRLTRHHHVYRVKDLIIDGLSMAANGRSELEGVVERNGGQPRAILAVMRQETAPAALGPRRPLRDFMATAPHCALSRYPKEQMRARGMRCADEWA